MRQRVTVLKCYFKKKSKLLQVTEFPEQNKFGVKNMIGNVWEWTQDWWEVEHSASPKNNPVCIVIFYYQYAQFAYWHKLYATLL